MMSLNLIYKNMRTEKNAQWLFLFEKDVIKIQGLPLSSAVAYLFVHLNHIHSITYCELRYSTDILENARLENGSLFMVNGAYVSDSLLVCKCIAHITNTNATSFRIHSLASYYYYNTMYRTRIHDKKITFATDGNWENCLKSLLRYWPGVQKNFQDLTIL